MTTTADQDRILLSEEQLNDLHKAELAACVDENPGNTLSIDHPLRTLHEQHRREWEARIEARSTLETAEKRAARKAEREAETEATRAEKGTTTASEPRTPSENHCIDCQALIPPTGRRGRPAKRCEPCKARFEAEQAAVANDPGRECGACRRGGRGRHLKNCENAVKSAKPPTKSAGRKIVRQAPEEEAPKNPRGHNLRRKTTGATPVPARKLRRR